MFQISDNLALPSTGAPSVKRAIAPPVAPADLLWFSGVGGRLVPKANLDWILRFAASVTIARSCNAFVGYLETFGGLPAPSS